MKDEQKPSFKDRLNKDVDNQSASSNDPLSDGTHQIARDMENIPNVSFITEDDDRAFTYNYLQHVGMDIKSGDIDLNFTFGKVIVRGKNLRQLYLDLKRNKVTDVDINNENINDITITLHGD